MCKDRLLLSDGDQLGAQWAHKESLQFATSSTTNGKLTIEIQELQPTSTPTCVVVKSFPVIPHLGDFSFSPLFFHASFVTKTEVIILDVQGSNILLQTTITQPLYQPPGQFSPDGCFFACGTSEYEIHIWRNSPGCYVPWNTLQPRLPFKGFLFSPTTLSILTWGPDGIQLLDTKPPAGPQPSNEIKPPHQYRNHLVACSADRTYIVTAQQEDSIVTVLNSLSGTPLQFIHVGTQIQDIKLVCDVIFVVDRQRLVSWKLEAGEAVHSSGEATSSCIHSTTALSQRMHNAENFALSKDCSQIAFSDQGMVFLYDVKGQEVVTGGRVNGIMGFRFSQDGHQLCVLSETGDYHRVNLHLTIFQIVEDQHSAKVSMRPLIHGVSWHTLFQFPHGYGFGSKSEWVADSRGNKYLWLPPSWRKKSMLDVRWEGDFLALVGSHHQKPIIIELQPLPPPFTTKPLARCASPLDSTIWGLHYYFLNPSIQLDFGGFRSACLILSMNVILVFTPISPFYPTLTTPFLVWVSVLYPLTSRYHASLLNFMCFFDVSGS